MRFLILISLVLSPFVWAHKGEKHDQASKAKLNANLDKELSLKYAQINSEYLANVKPIFEKSCFSCHSNSKQYPWYYSLPGIKQLIDHDTREAKVHLDFSDDFPFISHGTPSKDLEAILRSIKENTMPPLRYKIMHWDAELSEDEVRKVKDWVYRSKEVLH